MVGDSREAAREAFRDFIRAYYPEFGSEVDLSDWGPMGPPDELVEWIRTFADAGVNRFGSGWSWLVHDGSGLAVVGSANQDNPISKGQTPLVGVDVWEHAYYLKYQNRRPDYIDAWWNVVLWSKVAERFAAV